MPLVGCEPAVPESERPQTRALDQAATVHINTCLNKYQQLFSLLI
jgi:hypothetical protein